jgi:hypothetical protein
MAVNFGVQAVVDVYPYEGGQYTLSSSNGYLRSVSTSKSLNGGGNFSIELSPGGPTGTTSPTWSQLLTPMSMVVIALARGPYKQIVMLGVITGIGETQSWGDSTTRSTSIVGQDLTYFFSQTNFYNLAFLYGDAAAALGGVGMLAAADNGLIAGTPAQLGAKWYTDIMAGSQGILSTTMFNVNGNSYPFKNIFGTLFQPMDIDIAIPTGANFLADQGNWLGKFQSFFQYPWYEFFINTVLPGYYHETEAANVITSSSSQFDGVTAVVVARVNPLPKLANKGTPASPNFSIDMTAWQALTSYSLDQASFFSSQVGFSGLEAKNFYMINPISIIQSFGDSNANINPFMMTQLLWKDQGSVNRYGYMPQTFETQWFFDYAGVSARQNAANQVVNAIQTLSSQLLTRAVGVVHPLPLMGTASITMPLRPDIIVGNIFSYAPFKDDVTWDFYIDSVSHSFPFGGQPYTTLGLSRGLPATVYNTPEMLTAVLTGKATRFDGTLAIDNSMTGLTAVTLANAGSQETGFSTPQGGQKPGTP